MDTVNIDMLVVPEDLEWPVVGRTREGAIAVRREAVESIEELNGLHPGSLDSTSMIRLLTLWYCERRKLGFPKQDAFEQLVGQHQVA